MCDCIYIALTLKLYTDIVNVCIYNAAIRLQKHAFLPSFVASQPCPWGVLPTLLTLHWQGKASQGKASQSHSQFVSIINLRSPYQEPSGWVCNSGFIPWVFSDIRLFQLMWIKYFNFKWFFSHCLRNSSKRFRCLAFLIVWESQRLIFFSLMIWKHKGGIEMNSV